MQAFMGYLHRIATFNQEDEHCTPKKIAQLSLALLMAGCFLLAGATAGRAQTGNSIVIPNVTTQEQEDAVQLDVYFYLRDPFGRPITNATISSATVKLLDSDAEPVAATVSQPDTPLNIALLIDISGSMADTIDAVREAAQLAIYKAPPNARFAVIQFNKESRVVQGLTDDPFRARAAIDDISPPEGATCLYDTIYDAIELLNRSQRQGPLERKAVVVFTDGQDQLRVGSTEPCSKHTYSDVVNLALRTETPIHTIGLSSGAGDSIDEDELRGLADRTGAFSAIGQRAGVGGLFNSIFSGLNSQFVARAHVLPKQGRNQGVLQVSLSNNASVLPGPFEFNSSRDYTLPAPTVAPPTVTPAPTATPIPVVRVLVNGLKYQPEKNHYALSLSIDNPQVVAQIIISVESAQGLTIPSAEQTINLNGRDQLIADIPADEFAPGEEYVIKIKAVGKDGYLIEPPPKNYETESPGPILAEHKFKHSLPPEPPPQAEIEAVVVSFPQKQLVIDLGFKERVAIDRYEGFIINADTGQKIYDIERQLFPEGAEQLSVTLPPAIEDLKTEGDFKLSLTLITQDGRQVAVNDYQFGVEPPKPPGLFKKIGITLQNNQTFWMIVLIIAFGVFGWAVLSRRDRKQPFTLERPIVEDTIVGGAEAAGGVGGASRHPGIHMRVIQTPSPADRIERIITDFPCIIGRSSKAHVKFVGDKQISGRHAQITMRDDQFYLMDLGSANGTFVDNSRLAAKEKRRLGDVQTIRLGRRTSVELRIQYP
jgi:Mg-chelatase subunit ChlD